MRRCENEKGQALVLITVALIAMCGILGLGVDLGWSFYVHKTARAATDAGALAAAKDALSTTTASPPYACGSGGITCAALTPCFNTNGTLTGSLTGTSLAVGCLYAQQNGFQNGGHGGRQNLRIEAGVGTPPSAPGVAGSFYWVHMIAAEQIPQLFSAVLGNTNSLVSADSTAALTNQVSIGSLILLNRANDTSPVVGKGSDLTSNGGGPINVPGGIILSSNCHGNCSGGAYAGNLQGSTNVTAPFTDIYGAGTVNLQGNQATWTTPPVNGFGDISAFQDPESGKGQPPISTQSNYIQVPQGMLNSSICPSNVCAPGVYIATYTAKSGITYASGATIQVPNNFTFGTSSGFGQYVFFGGLDVSKSAVTFNPGEYVLAGVLASGTPVLQTANNTEICAACNAGTGSGTGTLFVLTDSSYGGNSNMATMFQNIPLQKQTTGGLPWSSLTFGQANFGSGADKNSWVEMTGLNSGSTQVQNAGLADFSSLLIWQDQQNSAVEYDSKGNLVTGCTGGSNDNPCTRTLTDSNSPGMTLWAGQNSFYNGIVYQPRGAWTTIHSTSSNAGALRIITGGVNLQGSPGLNLTGTSNPITRLVATLVH